MTMEQLRPEVAWFALQMEMKLRKNDHKGGWQDDSLRALLRRLKDELGELHWELIDRAHAGHDLNIELVIDEATDVANFAMMIADNAQSGRD